MTPREVFDRFHTLVRDFDIRAIDYFAPNGVFVMPFAPPGFAKRVEGRDAIRAMLAPRYTAAREAGRKLGPYHNLRIHDTEHPEVLIVEFDLLVGNPDGTTEGRSFIQVFQIRDDQIVEQRDYFDSFAMASRLRAA
jgi:hypothetical protein